MAVTEHGEGAVEGEGSGGWGCSGRQRETSPSLSVLKEAFHRWKQAISLRMQQEDVSSFLDKEFLKL